jgi:hypothetical protein
MRVSLPRSSRCTRQEIEGLDALAAELGQSLLQTGKEIDVTPHDSRATKAKDTTGTR